jgi:hypothetical protein
MAEKKEKDSLFAIRPGLFDFVVLMKEKYGISIM